MQIQIATFPEDLSAVQHAAKSAFSLTPDSSLSEWFSFDQMTAYVNEGRGLCLKAVEDGHIQGMIYAQQENPINGKRGWINGSS